MKIVTSGLSRLVFIYGDYAIKIPWLNPVAIRRTYIRNRHEGKLEQKIERFGKNKIVSLIMYIPYILNSNKREYLYFLENKDKEYLLPILKTFFFGYILVQPRGDVFNISDKRWKKFMNRMKKKGVSNIDLLKSENFCDFKGKITLLDYANTQTQEELEHFDFSQIINSGVS